MSNQIVNSRLSILYFNKSYLYTEDHTVIEQDDQDILFKNNLIIKDIEPTDVYYQERYNIKINNTHSNVKFTYKGNDKFKYNTDNILKPLFLESGFNKYVFQQNNTRFDNEHEFINNIKEFINEYNIHLSMIDEMFQKLSNGQGFYDTIELTIMNDKLLLQITYPQHIFEEEKIIDLNNFSDTGMFFTTKENKLDTNVQGMIYKLNENKFQKTNFYISLYENDLTEMELFDLKFHQDGIHPDIFVTTQGSKDLKTYNPYANNCNRYLLLDVPKQAFVNKFDNQIKFDDKNWKLVDISEESIDLEAPDYKIDSYGNAYYLFKKENFDLAHVNDVSDFKFNLHNRYIDSAFANQKNYSHFEFEYFAFDHCKDVSRDFIMTPFNQKSHLGGYYVKNFANPSLKTQNTYTNLLKHGKEVIEIPYPNTSNFYKIQASTWLVVFLSISYLLKKIVFSNKKKTIKKDKKKH
ncbi:uncharacterized protein HGUI_01788 [Hanseniaspora guilliermondii]|uniref:Protein PBN1 n=1 Tax=Hanseniaspora guilliermondii TaxID=56406 RepID=A0A1L0B1C7_9ASCO|nr:uncharacterized protein HGUI_01788 [Hanseniaspora guilliermondii]